MDGLLGELGQQALMLQHARKKNQTREIQHHSLVLILAVPQADRAEQQSLLGLMFIFTDFCVLIYNSEDLVIQTQTGTYP